MAHSRKVVDGATTAACRREVQRLNDSEDGSISNRDNTEHNEGG